jgi:hypothetical protein
VRPASSRWRGRRARALRRLLVVLVGRLRRGRRGLALLERREELDHAVDDGLGPRGAAGDVGAHRDDGVDAALDVVAALEDAAGAGAGADGDHELGLGHLLVDALDAVLDLPGDRPRAEQHVGVARGALERDAEALDVEARG